MVQKGEDHPGKDRKPGAKRKPRGRPQVNYLNLKRALAGKGMAAGGRALGDTDRSQIINAAIAAVRAKNEGMNRREALERVRSRVAKGASVGGFVKGAKKGSSEGGRTKPVKSSKVVDRAPTKPKSKPNPERKPPTNRTSGVGGSRSYAGMSPSERDAALRRSQNKRPPVRTSRGRAS